MLTLLCPHTTTYTQLTHFFFFNNTATTEIYTLSLHDALPISIEKVFTGAEEIPAMVATMALESMPPLRNAPRGTSAIMRRRTDSFNSSRKRSTKYSSFLP